MKIRLQRSIVRDWREGDEESLVAHANNRNVSRNLYDMFPYPYTLDDARDWIRLATSTEPSTFFAIEIEGAAVGGVGFQPGEGDFRRSASIGFWLGESLWGRGVMTEVVVAVTDHAFANFDFCRLEARVLDWNPASMRVLEKAGYVREGRLALSVTKDDRTIDQVLYATTRKRA